MRISYVVIDQTVTTSQQYASHTTYTNTSDTISNGQGLSQYINNNISYNIETKTESNSNALILREKIRQSSHHFFLSLCNENQIITKIM